ncbi:M48 family metalloprotease [Vibrio harveyi]|uniref:M48 family metalloprotease n=1 Tax=Vibrio harveyi TaxID=669 RepID=UPI003BF70B6C
MTDTLEVRVDRGLPLPVVATGMFLLTIVTTYIIAYAAVLAYMFNHTNWLGVPDANELVWSITVFFGSATLFPIAALIYAIYSVSDSGTDSAFNKMESEPLDDDEKAMLERILNDFEGLTVSDDSSRTSISHSLDINSVYKFKSKDVNAWALGGIDKGYMAFSSESLSLPEDQIKGILLHEYGHLLTGDTKRMTFAKSFQNALVSFAMITPFKNFLRYTVFIMTQLILMKVSRDREFRADELAASLDKDNGIEAALQTIRDGDRKLIDYHDNGVYMFSVISRLDGLLATHPPLSERISRLSKRKAAHKTVFFAR